MNIEFEPYCGIAPVPAELWSRWNLDPSLLVALAALAVLCFVRGRVDYRGRLALAGAVIAMVLAFISPLCALASALFSARVAHHLVLIAAAAPLLAVAMPLRTFTAAPISASAMTLVHTIVVWTWHIPAPYTFALSSDAAYWLMQLSLLLSAYFLWSSVLSVQASRAGAALGLLGTAMQMGFLGALLVFAPRPVFTPHFGTTAAFGLTELQDQQLAGLLMWIPAMLPYLAVALAKSAALLPISDETAAR